MEILHFKKHGIIIRVCANSVVVTCCESRNMLNSRVEGLDP